MSFVFYPDNFVDEGFLSSVLQRDRSNRTIRLCAAFFLLKRLEQYLCNAAFDMHITVCCQMNASEAVFSNGTVYYAVKCGSNV